MTTLRFGGYQPERSVHTRAARALGEAWRARLAGPADFQMTPQIIAAGHAAADLLSMTESGELDMCYFASSYLVARVPELGVLDLPFPDVDRARIWRRLDGEAGQRLKAAVARRTGYELLACWDNGVRHVSNGVRAIRRPADGAGLTIRTLDNAFHQRMFAALGFSPRFLDVKDLGPAVRERTIDAQENPLTNLVNFDLHKTHRFVSMTAHLHGIALLLAHRASLDRLPADARAALDVAVAQATGEQRAMAAAEDAACLEALAADGVEVIAAADLDRPAWRAAVAAVVAQEEAAFDPDLLAAWRR